MLDYNNKRLCANLRRKKTACSCAPTHLGLSTCDSLCVAPMASGWPADSLFTCSRYQAVPQVGNEILRLAQAKDSQIKQHYSED